MAFQSTKDDRVNGKDYINKSMERRFTEDFPIGTTVQVDKLGTCIIASEACYALFPHCNFVTVEMSRDMTREEWNEYTSGWEVDRHLNKRFPRVALHKITT